MWVQRVKGWGSGQDARTLHLLHCALDVSPVAPEYRPATQLVHAVLAYSSAKRPAGHDLHGSDFCTLSPLAACLYVPGSHTTHTLFFKTLRPFV